MTYYAGQKLGNYQLVRWLGRGGFAEVYLGKHVDFNTYAAIKVLKRQTDFKTLNGFLEEARIITELEHPHIVRILQFGIEKRRPFLVMAYAPNGTLRDHYGRNVTSPALILPYVKQVAAALHYAHERKIVHCDVKPENMLLDAANNVLLSDFGLAMRACNTFPGVSSIADAGTMTYMAPEQLRGEPCAASDQYALGVVMYEWLCGCPPFDGSSMSIVKKHLQALPQPLRRHVPALSLSVERVVLKALEKEPQQRFASVQELALAFEEACEEVIVAGSLELLSPESSQEERLLNSMDVTAPVVVPVQVGGLSVQTPALSASLRSSALQTEAVTVANPAIASSLHKPYTSRRMMIAGLAGIGMTLCGIGIWRLGSGTNVAMSSAMQNSSAVGMPSPYPGRTPVTLKASTPTPSSARKKATRNSNTPTTSSTTNGAGPDSNTLTTSSTTNGDGNTPAPSTQSSNTWVQPTNTPDITPSATSTPSQNAALTVQVNAKNTVKNNKKIKIQIMTNIGNTPFQVKIDYFNLNNQNNQPMPDLISGTTDDTGNATISWGPSLPPGQIVSNTYVQLQVMAIDQQGTSVFSQTIQVQISQN